MMSKTKLPIDEVIKVSLTSFFDDLRQGSWTGRRERESISLYVFSHLLEQCKPNSVLYDGAQIGIEVAVPQIPRDIYGKLSGGIKPKEQVCKDVVIWPEPKMTCWDSNGKPTVFPLAILEWKFNEKRPTDWDTEWLKTYSFSQPDFVGYAVHIDRLAQRVKLKCKRFHRGEIENWLALDNE